MEVAGAMDDVQFGEKDSNQRLRRALFNQTFHLGITSDEKVFKEYKVKADGVVLVKKVLLPTKLTSLP